MFTEDEAKARWCPFARAADGLEDAASVNRKFGKNEPDKDCYCMASACMAWRWGQKPNPDWKPEISVGWPDFQNPAAKQPMTIDDREHGYCGLAGKAG